MKLPKNSLGISDANAWHECPAKFYEGMQRHTGGQGRLQYSPILAYGQAVHEGAEWICAAPDAYIDDVVDFAWRKWGSNLNFEWHEELKQDLVVCAKRTIEASNLTLIDTEIELSTTVHIGRKSKDGPALDEEEDVSYKIRGRIDALYVDKSDPNHYIIRDFKTTRRKKFQSDIDNDPQFTCYDLLVRDTFPNAKTVTIWYDQLKHGEIFSSRTDKDRMVFEEWMRSTIIAILDTPVDEVQSTIHLNEWCAWCPLLETCGIVDEASEFARVVIADQQKKSGLPKKMPTAGSDTFEDHVSRMEKAKGYMKVLDTYAKSVNKELKKNPGVYAGREYIEVAVSKSVIDADKLVDAIGYEEAIALMPKVPVSKIPKQLQKQHAVELDPHVYDSGYSMLRSRKVKANDDD